MDTDEIVKGYEVEKGKYVLLSESELDDIKLDAKKTIDLVQFVDQDDIPPIYFDRPYFVGPDEDNDEGNEAYVVLREALSKTGKIGLGQMIVRGKGQVVALKPCGEGLLMESLRYADEIRRADAFFAEVPDIDPEKELVDLAEELIGRKSAKFDPSAFTDGYTAAVRELIDARLEDREPRDIEAPEAGGQVIDLMQALRRSVEGKAKSKSSSGGGKSKKAATRKTASKKKAA